MKGQPSKKVFVGVSGGVDSSVALALLQEQGFDVTGVFLKVWSPDFLPCTWRDERRSAMRVCATLGVPFMTLDCEKEYKELVVDYMLSEYKSGRTPNPDVFCNKYVKFGVFLKKAMEMGADFVATGHYARVHAEYGIKNKELRMGETANENSPFIIHNSKFLLQESADKEKDQSYFLHQLGQFELSHTLFPIGHLQKSEVRELAKKFNLPTAEKKDSQGLCFIGKVDMKEFLAYYISTVPGDVLSEKNEIIGRHNGAIFYTIGERHGFEIFKHSESDPRMFVVSKDIEKNTITVASHQELNESTKLKSYKLQAISWTIGNEPDLSHTFDIRFRYRQEKQKCKIVKTDSGYEIIPQEVQQGIAPGQSAVIYLEDVCLGGGVME